MAWNRSILALMAVEMITVRHAFLHDEVLAMVLTGATIVLAVWGLVVVTRRYRAASTRLWRNQPLPDGKLIAATSALTTLVGLVGLILVVSGSV